MGTDSVEWMRARWVEAGEPAPDHFAAMASLLRLHQIVVGAMERILKPHELGRTAYLVLATLAMSHSRTFRLGELSKQLMVHPTTITMVCEQLERRGLAVRRPHPTDRRTVLATITDEGLAVIREANRSMASAGFGLDGVSLQLATDVTEIVRQVRERTGDLDRSPPAT